MGKYWKLSKEACANRRAIALATWRSRKVRAKRLHGMKRANPKRIEHLRQTWKDPALVRRVTAKVKQAWTLEKRERHSILFSERRKLRKGYKNKGSFKKGDGNTIAKRVIWIREHHIAVRKMAEKLRREGKEVWTCFDGIPDLIIKEKSRLVAIEVTRRKHVKFGVRKKHNGGIFDKVQWVDLKGRDHK